MNSVRPYKEKDRERVQQICLEDADIDRDKTDDERYILIMYCNYYIEQEPENCFVAVDSDDNAVGYIFCSENYDKYERVFTEKYLCQAAAISPKKYVEAKLDMMSHSMFRKKYPAHMHIDIDEAYQRMGLGSLLVSALKAHLRKKRISGVMLVVGANNEKGINFYKKNGFKNLIATKLGNAMALDFD